MVPMSNFAGGRRNRFILEGSQRAGIAEGTGQALALSGDTLAVGSLGQKVRVYERLAAGWVLRQELITSCRASSIAMQAGTLLLRGGEPGSPGSVTVYGRSGTQWVGRATLHAPSPQPYDNFGHALAISGASLVATAQNLGPQAARRGSAYLFSRQAAGWACTAELQPAGADSRGEAYGVSAALDGDIAIVGAPPFAAYIFHRGSGGWSLEARLTLPDLTSANGFGASVAIAKDVVVVGDNSGAGAAVFSRSGGVWRAVARGFGGYVTSVGALGNWIAVGLGAPGAAGGALLYRRLGQQWKLSQKIPPPAGAPGSFGFRVALSDRLLAVSATDFASSASAIFEFASSPHASSDSEAASSGESGKAAGTLHPALAKVVRKLTLKDRRAHLLVLTPYSNPVHFEAISSSRMLTWGLKANGIDYTLHHPGVPRPDIAAFDAVLCWAYGFKQRPAALASCIAFEAFARAAGVPVVNSLASFSIAHSSCLRAWNAAGIACAQYGHVNSFAEIKLPYPLILRTDGVHRGQHMHLVHTPEQAEAVFERAANNPLLPPPNLAIQFIDTSGPDGLFRKWRSYVIGSRVVPRQLQLNTKWIVNLDGAQPLQQAIEEDRVFYEGSEPKPELLIAAAAALGSEIVALDYSKQGDSYIFWEGNRNFDLSIGGQMWNQFCKATGRTDEEAVASIFRLANAIAHHILDVIAARRQKKDLSIDPDSFPMSAPAAAPAGAN